MSIFTCFKLNNGVEIPALGLGVYLSTEGPTAQKAIQAAFEAGYRHVDTAKFYNNERSVGKMIQESDLLRENLFVTTKLWNSDHGYDSTLRAFDKSQEALGLETIDLYLIHWPVPDLRLESWRALERIYEEGRVRAIGVSNYMTHHLQELLAYANIPPAINQIELHPFNYRFRQPVLDLCIQENIVVEAYSPLTKAQRLNDPNLTAIGKRYQKTPAQILIRFILQQNLVVLPKSANPSRIRENADVFDFAISPEDMLLLEEMNENWCCTWDPTNAP